MTVLPGDLVLLDVGNTHVRIFHDGTLRKIKTAELDKLLPELAGKDCAAASVVPDCSLKLEHAGVFLVGKEHCAGLDLTQIDSSTLGADRIANAVALAAAEMFPAVAVDFGTAITFEALDAQGRFAGGAILPGRAMMRTALTSETAQLPAIAVNAAVQLKMGTDTRSSIALGCDLGAIGAVKEILAAIVCEIGGNARIVGTGGDAEAFAGKIPLLNEIDITLTLKGIALAYNYERKHL